jgi:hypothetical protein
MKKIILLLSMFFTLFADAGDKIYLASSNPYVLGGTVSTETPPASPEYEVFWSLGEACILYNTTSGIDAAWNLGESYIFDEVE